MSDENESLDLLDKTLFLSEEFINKAVINQLLQKEEFKAAVNGKQLVANIRWLFSKWDDPNHLAAIKFMAPEAPFPATSEQEFTGQGSE